MISVEKPGTPEEVLKHHGVLGMKWGRRTGGSSGGLSARQRSQAFAAKHPTGASRAKEIRRARARDLKRRTDFTTEKNPAKRDKLKQVYLNHPDRATARRTTRGEKVAIGILAGVLAPAGVGVAVGVGLGARTAHRHHIERQQQK